MANQANLHHLLKHFFQWTILYSFLIQMLISNVLLDAENMQVLHILHILLMSQIYYYFRENCSLSAWASRFTKLSIDSVKFLILGGKINCIHSIITVVPVHSIWISLSDHALISNYIQHTIRDMSGIRICIYFFCFEYSY